MGRSSNNNGWQKAYIETLADKLDRLDGKITRLTEEIGYLKGTIEQLEKRMEQRAIVAGGVGGGIIGTLINIIFEIVKRL